MSENPCVSEGGFLYYYTMSNFSSTIEIEREINILSSKLSKELEERGYDAEEVLQLSVYSEGIDEKMMNYGWHPISNNQNSETLPIPNSIKEEFKIFNMCVNKKVELVKSIQKKKKKGMKKFGRKCIRMIDIIAQYPENVDVMEIVKEYNKNN